ncbi:hypothetical protein NOR_01078 [Metarhizium rileyi]|uniref:Uncharacterized protein n=1 Tax=Metarhizium rileyi (strain RCEF 4871) TaxID=1649241 RepID=A0A162JXX9_METRR|nr:hypothetical protein NOR_01078 [Metarhizium rileyi RCEF 4871]
MKGPWLQLVKWTAILLLSQYGDAHPAPPSAGPQIPRPEEFQSLSFSELDRAASDAIQALKRSYPNGKVMVFGATAMQKYLPGYRATRDVDIFQNIGGYDEVKNELMKDPRFYTRQQVLSDPEWVAVRKLFYKNPNGKSIEIDLPGRSVLPFEPVSAKVLSTIPAGSVPYVSVEELIIAKIWSSRSRPDASKQLLDIADAKALLEKYPDVKFSNDIQTRMVAKFRAEHGVTLQEKPATFTADGCKRDLEDDEDYDDDEDFDDEDFEDEDFDDEDFEDEPSDEYMTEYN